MKDDPKQIDVPETPELEDENQDGDEKPHKKKKKDIVGDDGVIRFSLDRLEIPVELEDPENGSVLKCVMRELSGTQRDKYLNNLGSRVKSNRDGVVLGVKNFDGLQANLLTRCLFIIQDDGKEKAISEAVVQKFPAKVQTALFDKAKEISGMDDDAEDEAGND